MSPESLLTCIETKKNQFQKELIYKNDLKLKVKRNHTSFGFIIVITLLKYFILLFFFFTLISVIKSSV